METSDLELILRALAFAADKHRNQRRKGEEQSPYINHPIAVANVLASEGGVHDPIVLCAALLHDTIEDTQATAGELEVEFGARIAAIVLEVSDDKSLAKEVRKRLQIEHAPRLSHEAKLVKLADKICNLRDMAERPPADWEIERRTQYFDWARAVVDGLRGANARLEALFDAALSLRPRD